MIRAAVEVVLNLVRVVLTSLMLINAVGSIYSGHHVAPIWRRNDIESVATLPEELDGDTTLAAGITLRFCRALMLLVLVATICKGVLVSRLWY